MNQNESNNELDVAARHWAAHFQRLGVKHIDEYGGGQGLTYIDASGYRYRVWAWSFDAHRNDPPGVAVRVLNDDDETAVAGAAIAYFQ